MLNNFKYILKVWFTTIIVSAVLVCIQDGMVSFSTWDHLQTSTILVFFSIAVGFIFSFPTIFIAFILLQFFFKLRNSLVDVRLSLTVIAVFGVFVSFYLYDTAFFSTLESFTWPLIYAAVMVGSIWFYKLAPAHPETDNE